MKFTDPDGLEHTHVGQKLSSQRQDAVKTMVCCVAPTLVHSKKKKHFELPFLVLRLVTNRRLIPVPQRTMSDGASQAPCYMVLQQTLLGPT